MAYKLLYIDDDTIRVTGSVSGFSDTTSLSVYSDQPKDSLEEQVAFICNQILDKKCDGLILDLRLDDYKNSNGKTVQYRGTTLAQEIRTRQKEGTIACFPIFLFSGNDKISKSLDTGGAQCFDLCIEKEHMDAPKYPFYRNRFCSIIKAYEDFSKSCETSSLLDLDDSQNIDIQFLEDISNKIETSNSITSLLHFFQEEVLDKSGVLICEAMLAARLGIDIEKSEDWDKVKYNLSVALYKGVLSQSWERWWMDLVNLWWFEKIDQNSSLRCLSAEQRVEKIKSKLNLDHILAASPLDKTEGKEYWTLCKAYLKPIDPIDGLVIINQDHLYSWQDVEYVSIDAALKRKKINIWRDIANFEKYRLNELQELYSKHNLK